MKCKYCKQYITSYGATDTDKNEGILLKSGQRSNYVCSEREYLAFEYRFHEPMDEVDIAKEIIAFYESSN